MNEQTSLFNIENDFKLPFNGNYCNEDWSNETRTVNGIPNIVNRIDFKLKKSELKEICRKAAKVNKPMQYGYEVLFEDGGVKKEIFVRFINFTTSKRRSVFEHIDLYFDEEVKWRKERGLIE